MAGANSNGFANHSSNTDDSDNGRTSEKRSQACFGAGILRYWACSQKIFILTLEILFEKSAMFISRRPFHVIFIILFAVIVLTSGFARLEVENNVKYLFLPEDSEASLDIRKARNFEFELELRQEEVIILPKNNKSVLSRECLTEIIDLHRIVTQIKMYEQYCFRPNSNGSCASINLLEIFDYQKKNLVNISQHIQVVLQNNAFLMSNGRRLKDNFNQIFGKAASNGSLHSTNALRFVYLMKEYSRGEENRKHILKWEKTFLKKVSSFSKNTTCANIVYTAERSLDDSVAESTGSDIKFFALTFMIMGIFSGIVNGRCADGRFGHQLLGFASQYSIYLGVTAALGFLMFLGVPFVSMVGVLPFLVVSIGIDDVFIILHELNEMVRQNIPAMHMLSGTMARSGPTITMTTLTDLVAFAVSCRSIFPAIRFFCTYAALTIWSAFFMLVTFFVGFMWFDIKRINAERRDFLPCLMRPPPNKCCANTRENGIDNVMKAWGKAITSLPGKFTVCLCSLLLLSGGIYGAINIDESFSRQLLTTKNSHFREFLNVYEENFHLNIEVNIIFPGQVGHSVQELRTVYSIVENIVKFNQHFVPGSVNWLSEYLSWASESNVTVNDTSVFYKTLSDFVSIPEYRRFAQDLKFSQDKTHLIASRILVYSKSNPDSIFQRDMMVSIRNDLSHSTSVTAFAIALPFLYFEQYAHVFRETIRNVIVAGISILFISSMFLNHPAVIFCLLCGFVGLILELLGLMYIWDVSINSISMINLVMALGFSVDYNAHVAYHFVSSKAASPELRVIDALGKIGGSVFLGGLSTFLGMVPTGFASSTVFQIFFKMFVGIVVLGLIHGLAILPVYLTLLGKIFDFSEMNVDSLLRKWLNRMEKQKFQEVSSHTEGTVNAKNNVPVAIVGIGCRFPGGANSKDAFWDMLVEGRSGIGTYPTNRPSSKDFFDSYNPGKGTPGKHYVLTGAFLDKITGFDAYFFGISPTECRSMDPQQRLLLQVVYEAIEDAGMRLEDLQECRTGVYVGSMNLEYAPLVMDTSNIRKIDQFSSTGCALSVIANRISFALNLTGPSLTIDTACSSSLVAFDVAFGHLQTGECDVAIVCAPNILITGEMFHTACCRSGLLAQDGRCKSFDIKGDGYGRGEGVAAVVIKPTKTAIDDRDDIYAEVLACGVNSDGQTAIPMTAPSEVTQSILFQRVLQESGLSKDDIQYIEAHGTGTAVGDVVEMSSLAAVYGNSNKRILRLGSVKSNINHTESTAGLAGLIKTCMMIKHGKYVPTINVHEIKPQLKMSERRMMVQVSYEPWQTQDGTPRAAAVSSYGFGGANAHLIVKQVTKYPVTVFPSRRISNRVLTLSAASEDALRAMAKKLSQSLKTKTDDDELLKDNICYSLNEKYTVHSHRLAVAFSSFQGAAKALDMFSDQERGWEKLVAFGDVNKTRNKVVFLYGGQGSQWYGMARDMLIHEPKFKESIEKIDALLKRYKASWSLITELKKSEKASRLHENPIGQTALFAIHFALTELLESWGIAPSAVVGHSLGEISAAWASGALHLHKALQLVLFRSQLHEKCSPTGCMAAIGLSEEKARNMLRDIQMENEVDVAVINSPGNVVLSGSKESIGNVENHVSCTLSDVFWKKLTTSRAYHSKEMDEMKELYFKITSEFNVRQTSNNIPFYSTVTGTQLSGKLLSLDHWWKNIRQTVLLDHALTTMFSDGYQVFIEINASPQLAYHVRQTWSEKQKLKSLSSNDAVVIQTLPKMSSSQQQHLSFLQNCVAHLFTNGVSLSWEKVQGSGSKSFIPRPTYPWQETEFWYREKYPSECVTFLDENKTLKKRRIAAIHPLLGKSVPTEMFTGLHAWEAEINLHNISFINDHKLIQAPDPVIPAAVYVEMILAMALQLSPSTTPDVHNISFDNLLATSNNDSHIIRTRLLPQKSSDEKNRFQVTLVQDNEDEMLLSEGSIKLGINDWYGIQDESQKGSSEKVERLKSTMSQLSKDDLGKEREKAGFKFGPQFDLITEAWSCGDEALCVIRPTKEIDKETSAYAIHPSIIDACFQSMLLLKGVEGKFVPRKITHITMVQKPTCTDQFYIHTKIVESEKTPTANITLMDRYGRPVMIFEKFITAEISPDKTKITFENTSFTFGWEQVTSETSTANQNTVWLLLKDQNNLAERFSRHVPDCDTVHFVDVQHASDITRNAFSEVLDELLKKMKDDERLLVINFWPVDCSKFTFDASNFDATHELAFENCLSISQEILQAEAFAKNIHLVFVTSDVVTIPQPDRHPTNVTSDTFPWSASLFGFRRTFSEEISKPSASTVDLPSNPSDQDLRTMAEDVRKSTVEEELVYRDGVRYANRFKKVHLDGGNLTKQESPVTKNGEQKPFKVTSMSGQWFLQKTSNKRMKENSNKMKIDVDFVCPMLQKPWLNMKMNDRVCFAGRLYDNNEEIHSTRVVGICKIDDLGSFINAEKCCFAQMDESFSGQQAASLSFPMAMSYHILMNLLRGMKGKTILVYCQNEEVCNVFACVAVTLGVKVVVCLVRDRSSKERMLKFENSIAVTIDEIASGEPNSADLIDLDAVCLLSKSSSHVIRQIIKYLKPCGNVISLCGEENIEFNPFVSGKDAQCIMSSFENITEDSDTFSTLVGSCCSALRSRKLLERLLNISQHVSSIYEVINKESRNENSCLSRRDEIGFYTISLKPKNVPDKVAFYNLPLDENGFKADRTYLVIGGVRGFGFEFAKWMVQNGAKTVMCTARSAPSEKKKADVQMLERKTGSRIFLRQADVTSWRDMNKIREELESLPEVAGIVFSAMVVKDQLLKDADLKICKKVVETKIKGGAVLHELSLSMELDFFIMFSSISGILGNVGQVAYSAANSFLDQLCEYRRHKLGLPALSVNWGPISGAGVLERNTNIKEILKTAGYYSLHYTTGIEFLKRLLLENSSETQVCLSPINWQVYLQNHSSSRLQLIREETLVITEGNKVMTLEDLALQPLEFRVNYVQKFIQRLLASWSGADAAELDLNVGLHKYGIDSIGATQMRLRIENNIGATFETYYFIQPKTTGLTIINDILKQIENVSVSTDENDKPCDRQGKIENGDIAFDASEEDGDAEQSNAGECDEIELQAVQAIKEKVIPLYSPEDAVVMVFMIHGSQKSALALAPFALGFQQQTNVALYGIGVEDTSVEKNEYGTVMSLAQRYVGFIQNIQPRGPYYLAGYSFGGTVAYEMASELRRKNETVAMVFMVDTFRWFPKALATCSEYITKCTEINLKKMQTHVTRHIIDKMVFVALGITKNEVDNLYENLEDDEKVINALVDRAAEENVTFPLKETVDTVLYELQSAAKAHMDWQPSKICYDETITYICCDETNSFLFWRPDMWKSLVKRMDYLYVSGNHLALRDETRGKICGSMIMTTAAMKYQSSFSTFYLRPVRSRPQERLVESLKQGLVICMLSSPGASELVKGTLELNSEETRFSFKYQSFGRCVIRKNFLKDLSNILPGKHIDVIRRHHGHKPYIDFLLCMLNKNGEIQTFRAEDWQQLKLLTDALEALFGIPFTQ